MVIYKINFHTASKVFKGYNKDISKALRHSTPATTKKIYTHLLDVKQNDAINAVADIIDKK